MSQGIFPGPFPVPFQDDLSPTLALLENQYQFDRRLAQQRELADLQAAGRLGRKPTDEEIAGVPLQPWLRRAAELRADPAWQTASRERREEILADFRRMVEAGDPGDAERGVPAIPGLIQSPFYAADQAVREAAVQNVLSGLQGDYDEQVRKIDETGVLGGVWRGAVTGAANLGISTANLGADIVEFGARPLVAAAGALANLFVPGSVETQDKDYLIAWTKALQTGVTSFQEFMTGMDLGLRGALETERERNLRTRQAEIQAAGSTTPIYDYLFDPRVSIKDKAAMIGNMTVESAMSYLGGYAALRSLMMKAATKIPALMRLPGFYPIAGEARSTMTLLNPFNRGREIANTMVRAGLAAAPLGGQEVRSMMDQTTLEDFADSEPFQEALAMGMTPEEARREAIARTARMQYLYSGAVNGTLGIFGEMMLFGNVTKRLGLGVGGSLRNGLLRRGAVFAGVTAGTAASEGVTEGLEQMSMHGGMRTHGGIGTVAGEPIQGYGDTFKENAFLGGIMGGLMGGAGGARQALAIGGVPHEIRMPKEIRDNVTPERQAELISYFQELADGGTPAALPAFSQYDAQFMSYVMDAARGGVEAYEREQSARTAAARADEVAVTGEERDELNALINLPSDEMFRAMNSWDTARSGTVRRRIEALNRGKLVERETDENSRAYAGRRVPTAPLDPARVAELTQSRQANPDGDHLTRGYQERRLLWHLANPADSQKFGLAPERAAEIDAWTHNYTLAEGGSPEELRNTLTFYDGLSDTEEKYYAQRISERVPAREGAVDFGPNLNLLLDRFENNLTRKSRQEIVDYLDRHTGTQPGEAAARRMLKAILTFTSVSRHLNRYFRGGVTPEAFFQRLRTLTGSPDPAPRAAAADPRAGLEPAPALFTPEEKQAVNDATNDIYAEAAKRGIGTTRLRDYWTLFGEILDGRGFTFMQRRAAAYLVGLKGLPANPANGQPYVGNAENAALADYIAYLQLFGPEAQRREAFEAMQKLTAREREYLDYLTSDATGRRLFPAPEFILAEVDALPDDQKKVFREFLDGRTSAAGPRSQAAPLFLAYQKALDGEPTDAARAALTAQIRDALDKAPPVTPPAKPVPVPLDGSAAEGRRMQALEDAFNNRGQPARRDPNTQTEDDYLLQELSRFANRQGLTRAETQLLKYRLGVPSLPRGYTTSLDPWEMANVDAILYEIYFGHPEHKQSFQEDLGRLSEEQMRYAQDRTQSRDLSFLVYSLDEVRKAVTNMEQAEKDTLLALLDGRTVDLTAVPFASALGLYNIYQKHVAETNVLADKSQAEAFRKFLIDAMRQSALAPTPVPVDPRPNPLKSLDFNDGVPAEPREVSPSEDARKLLADQGDVNVRRELTWVENRYVDYENGQIRDPKGLPAAVIPRNNKRRAYLDAVLFNIFLKDGGGRPQAIYAKLWKQFKGTQKDFAYLKAYYALIRPRSAAEMIEKIRNEFRNDRQKYKLLHDVLSGVQTPDVIIDVTSVENELYNETERSKFHLTPGEKAAFDREILAFLASPEPAPSDILELNAGSADPMLVASREALQREQYHQTGQGANPDETGDFYFRENTAGRNGRIYYHYDAQGGRWESFQVGLDGSLQPLGTPVRPELRARLAGERFAALARFVSPQVNGQYQGMSAPARAGGVADPIARYDAGREQVSVLELGGGSQGFGTGTGRGLAYILSGVNARAYDYREIQVKGEVRYQLTGTRSGTTLSARVREELFNFASDYLLGRLTGRPLPGGPRAGTTPQGVNLMITENPEDDPDGGGPGGGQSARPFPAPDGNAEKILNSLARLANDRTEGYGTQARPGDGARASEPVEADTQGAGGQAGSADAQAAPGSGAAAPGPGDGRAEAPAAGTAQGAPEDTGGDAESGRGTRGPRGPDEGTGAEPAEGDGGADAQGVGRAGGDGLSAGAAQPEDRIESALGRLERDFGALMRRVETALGQGVPAPESASDGSGTRLAELRDRLVPVAGELHDALGAARDAALRPAERNALLDPDDERDLGAFAEGSGGLAEEYAAAAGLVTGMLPEATRRRLLAAAEAGDLAPLAARSRLWDALYLDTPDMSALLAEIAQGPALAPVRPALTAESALALGRYLSGEMSMPPALDGLSGEFLDALAGEFDAALRDYADTAKLAWRMETDSYREYTPQGLRDRLEEQRNLGGKALAPGAGRAAAYEGLLSGYPVLAARQIRAIQTAHLRTALLSRVTGTVREDAGMLAAVVPDAGAARRARAFLRRLTQGMADALGQGVSRERVLALFSPRPLTAGDAPWQAVSYSLFPGLIEMRHRSGAYDYMMLAHEAMHAATDALSALESMGFAGAGRVLRAAAEALGLPGLKTSDYRAWVRGGYESRPTERLAYAVNGFLHGLSGGDALGDLALNRQERSEMIAPGDSDRWRHSPETAGFLAAFLTGGIDYGHGVPALSAGLAGEEDAAGGGRMPGDADTRAGPGGRVRDTGQPERDVPRPEGEVGEVPGRAGPAAGSGGDRADDGGDPAGLRDAGARPAGAGRPGEPGSGTGGMAGRAGFAPDPGTDLRESPESETGWLNRGGLNHFLGRFPANPADDIIAREHETPQDSAVDDILEEIRQTIRESHRRRGVAAPPSPDASAAPAPLPRDLAESLYKTVMRDRERAAARYVPELQEFAKRSLSPVREMADWHGLGARMRFKLEDTFALFRRWAANAVGGDENIPLLKALSLFPGLKNDAYTRLAQDVLNPLTDQLRRLSKEKGVSQREILALGDQIATIWHVLTEGSREFRDQLVQEIDRAVKARDDARAGTAARARATRLHGALELNLRLYDDYQRTGAVVRVTAEEAALLSLLEDSPVSEGDLFVPKVVGGIPDVTRRQMWAELRRFFTEEEMLQIKDLVTAGYSRVTEFLLENGLLRPEDMKDWPAFLSFVALNIPRNRSALQGRYPWGYIYNPRRFDFHRLGSRTPAAGAIDNLFKIVDNVAETVGRRDFDRELHRFHHMLKEAGDTFGLQRVRLNREETAITESRYKGREHEVMQAPGWVVRVREGKSGTLNSYKYFFDFRDAAETDLMNESIAAERNNSQFLRALTVTNRWQGMAHTKFTAAFAPGSAVKDLLERLYNQYSRDSFVRDDGSLAGGPEIVRRMGSLLTNPDFYRAYYRTFVLEREDDSALGDIMREFRHSGANFTQLSLVNTLGRDLSAADRRRQMEETGRVRRAITGFRTSLPVRLLHRVFDRWNDSFNAFAPALQFAAMRLEGLNRKEAAADTLDMMNYYKKGKYDSIGSAFFLFYRPVVQGSMNLLRSLAPGGKRGTPLERARGAVAFLALAGLSAMMHGLLSDLDDDDETGLNPYDGLPFETVSSAMLLPAGDGGYVKVPVGFGGPKAFWGIGAAASRLGKGLLTPGQAASHAFMSFMKQVAPDTAPAYAFLDHPGAFAAQTFLPQVLRPLVDLAVNRDYFGQEIARGQNTTAKWQWQKGNVETAPMWHWWARTVHETLGLDGLPESWRHAALGYAWGPVKAMMAWGDAERLRPEKYPSATAILGPMSGLGLQSFYTAEPDTSASYLYLVKGRFLERFKRLGVQITSLPGDKMEGIAANMREAGFNADEIRGYLAIEEFENKKRGLDDDFRKKARPYTFGDVTPSSALVREFQHSADEIYGLFDGASRLLSRLDLLGKGMLK